MSNGIAIVPGFVPFFKVAVEHDYFASGACAALSWEPTHATRHLMQRAGCHWINSQGQLSVHADESRIDVLRSFLENDKESFDLLFRLQTVDNAFVSYTGGTPAAPGRVLYLSSDAATRDDATNVTRLHPNATVDEAQYVDFDDARVFGWLSPPERLMRPAPFVHLRLGADDFGKACRIRFAARETLWKYFLFGGWPASSVEVIDLAKQVSFESGVSQQLADGRAAVTVRSTQPIALRQRPTHQFQLRSREDDGLVLIGRLPAPAPVNRGPAEDGMPVSEIYV